MGKRPPLQFRQWIGILGFTVVFVLVTAAFVWQGDILRAGLDPNRPFQTYTPPPAPDYAQADTWALNEARRPGAGNVAVFFVGATAYEGTSDWNSPVTDRAARRFIDRTILPNYAGPFAEAGPVSAPLYRHGTLYTRLSRRDDARDARAFAYNDVARAFSVWLSRHPDGPVVIAGAEQGGEMVVRLLQAHPGMDEALRRRLVAVYLDGVLVPAANPPLPPCASPQQTGCLVVWSAIEERDGAESEAERRLRRGMVWSADGAMVDLSGAPIICVNPISGSTAQPVAQARESRGATNATGLEWGARPALMAREVAAECRNGFLYHSRIGTSSFRRTGTWNERRKVAGYNLFYGDIQADVLRRAARLARD